MSLTQLGYADTPLPTPWNGMDIGAANPAGASKADGDAFTLTGAGGALAGTSDALHFVYQSITGDCALSARLSAGADANTISDAGLMARDAMAPTSNFAAVSLAPGAGARSVSRTTFSRDSHAAASDPVAGASPLWLKLVKRGTSIQGYMAADKDGGPGAWKPVGLSQPVASGMIYVGFFLTSRVNAGGAMKFDHVALATGPQALVDDGVYTMSPVSAPGMALEAHDDGVALAALSGSAGQKWRLVNKGGGLYSIHPFSNASLALSVPDSKPDFGTKIAVVPDHGENDQLWSIAAAGGAFTLQPKFNSGIGLDDYGGNSTPDAVIDIWGFNAGDPHLQWTFTPAQ